MSMIRYNIPRWLESDFMLKDKINSLKNRSRYRDIVMSYFRKMQADGQNASENRYGNVRAGIKKLWEGSEKDPTTLLMLDDFEPILLKKPSYRDHFIHSFNVFLLGYYIINKLNETYPDKNYFTTGESNFNLTWMLTSTFHDVAYPIQETKFWLNNVLEKFLGVNPRFSFNISQIVPMVYVDFMRMISCWHRHPMSMPQGGGDLMSMDWNVYNELSSKLIEKEHGVLGALMLSYHMAFKEGFLTEPDNSNKIRSPWDFLQNHLPACHAIGVHHLESIRVGFSKHPIAYILILCDELQDWGRTSTQSDRNMISLKDVNITETDPPKLQFEIETSADRKRKLDRVLKKRLQNYKKMVIIENKEDSARINPQN